MQRVWVGLVGVLATAVGLFGLWWGTTSVVLGTCGPLDRWIGASGCVAHLTVADFLPLPSQALAPIDGDRVRIFGYVRDEDRLQPAQVVMDLHSGAERERALLPIEAYYVALRSADGRRAALICLPGDICDKARPQGHVVSVADGAVIETLDEASASGWHFPGEQGRPPSNGAWIGEGVSAEPDTEDGGIMAWQANGPGENRTELERFSPPAPATMGPNTGSQAVLVSADGKWLAHINATNRVRGSVDVYDLAARELQHTVVTDAGIRVGSNAAWMTDGQHIVITRGSDAPASYESGNAQLYLFKVR